MLHEIKAVKQERGPGSRRWFESDGLDLVVWFDGAAAIIGFQLCYDLGRGEHALTWRPENGFVHSRVDMGDHLPTENLAPILEPNGAVPWPEVTRLFEERSTTLESGLREMVRERLGRNASGRRV